MMDMISVYLDTLSEAEEKAKEDSFGKKALKVAGLATLALGAGYATSKAIRNHQDLKTVSKSLKDLQQNHNVARKEDWRIVNVGEPTRTPYNAEEVSKALKQRDADMRYREKKIAARENPEWWKRNYHDYSPEFIHEQLENGWVYDPARKDFNKRP